MDKADSLLDFLIIAKSKLHNMESGQGIADFANSVAPLIYNIPNDYDQDRYWSATAELAGVTEERLKTIVDKPEHGNPGRIEPSQASDVLEEGDPIEEHLLSLVLQMGDLREHVVSMPAEVFREPDNRALFTVWQASSKLDRVSGELGEEITEKIQSLTERLLPPSDQARHVEDVAQCVQPDEAFLSLRKGCDLTFKASDSLNVSLCFGSILKFLEHNTGVSKYPPDLIPNR